MIYKISSKDVKNLDQSYEIEVEMFETKVYTDKDNDCFSADSGVVILSTPGIGPCIAFLASGRYYLDTDDKTEHYFAALYHHVAGEQSSTSAALIL